MAKYTATLIGEFRTPKRGLVKTERIRFACFARSREEAERLVEARLSSQRMNWRHYWTWEARGLKAVLPPAISDAPRYNREAVDQAIAKDKTITASEARLIHALLKGRQVRDQ
tara:strand:+ start:914 stop:1252 length:339 start_codon:yes stop_codon:yes gene_type:complete